MFSSDGHQITTISTWLPVVIGILALWEIPWKGVALWKAARNKDLAWFIILMIVNTLGILEILYIYIWGNKKKA
ncbi:MAG: DUF5652 family protein [Candidatus Berkelbacteria bacterium]